MPLKFKFAMTFIGEWFVEQHTAETDVTVRPDIARNAMTIAKTANGKTGFRRL
jgi:hypothetical protein